MEDESKSGSNLTSTYKDVGPYLGLGTQLAATIILMFFLRIVMIILLIY